MRALTLTAAVMAVFALVALVAWWVINRVTPGTDSQARRQLAYSVSFIDRLLECDQIGVPFLTAQQRDEAEAIVRRAHRKQLDY